MLSSSIPPFKLSPSPDNQFLFGTSKHHLSNNQTSKASVVIIEDQENMEPIRKVLLSLHGNDLSPVFHIQAFNDMEDTFEMIQEGADKAFHEAPTQLPSPVLVIAKDQKQGITLLERIKALRELANRAVFNAMRSRATDAVPMLQAKYNFLEGIHSFFLMPDPKPKDNPKRDLKQAVEHLKEDADVKSAQSLGARIMPKFQEHYGAIFRKILFLSGIEYAEEKQKEPAVLARP